LTGQIREVDLAARAIERKRLIAPLLDAHSERVAELDGLTGTPELPESAGAQRSDAQGRLHAGAAQLDRIAVAITKLDTELEAIDDIGNAPLAADTQELDATITAALRAGALPEQIEESRLQADLQRGEATERLARLDPAPPSIDALRGLAAPPREKARRIDMR